MSEPAPIVFLLDVDNTLLDNDRITADFLLHKVKLTQKLDDRTVEALQGEGAGAKTVLLTNGSVYFGHLQGYDGQHPVLTDVYYVVRQANQYLNGTLSIERLGGNLFFGIEMENIGVSLDGTEVVAVKDLGLDYNVFQLVARGLSVDSIRVYKPRPEVYALVPAAMQVEPGNVVFVSSNRWDVMGAASFGFRTAWVNRANLPDEYADRPPMMVLSDLSALLTIDRES